MHPHIESQLALQRVEELRGSGAVVRRAAARPLAASDEAGVVLRATGREDEPALATLAELDGKVAPSGPSLVAEVDGSIRAALPLDGGPAVADPFRRTGDLVALLEARARQLAGGGRQHRRFGRLAAAGHRRLV